MLVFGNDQKMRGCFQKMVYEGAGDNLSKAAYLELPDDVGLPNGELYDPLLVQNVSFGQKEKFNMVECFQNVIHTYAFGHDPKSSLVTVSFVAFLVASDGTDLSDAFDRFLTAYASNRLSENQQYSRVVIGKTALRGFLIGMSSSTNNALYNLQNFSMDLLAVEVQEV